MTDLRDAIDAIEPQSWQFLPAPSVVSGPSVDDGPFTYGLVAKVTLTRPGFGFRIEHDLPEGVDLVEARPRATVVGDHLIWQLGRVDPGQEIRLEIEVRPRSGAAFTPADRTSFTATYSNNLFFQAPIVRPRLTARLSGPAVISVGEAALFLMDVTGSGNWSVENARVKITLPPSFEHLDGPIFEFALGTVKRGEFRRVTIPAWAVSAGPAVIRAEVTGPADRSVVVEFPTNVTVE
jgi:hypothetical protein